MANGIIEINEADFEEIVLKSDVPVLVDFWAPWCGPCRMLAPVVENLAHMYQEKAKFVKVNVDNNPGLAIKYDVQSIPTVIIFSKGNIVENSLIGVKPITEYQRVIDSQLNSSGTDSVSTASQDSSKEEVQSEVDIKGIEDFKNIIQTEGRLVVVDFWAPWCGPCRVLKPSLEKITKDNSDKIILLKVNVDEPENQDIAQQYGISSIPQVNFFKGGHEVHMFIGAQPYEVIKQTVDELIK